MTLIDEILKQDLSDAERKAFKSLGDSADFKIVVKAMDSYILRLNAGLLTGTESEKGSSVDEFLKLRSFIYYWSKFVALTRHEEK